MSSVFIRVKNYLLEKKGVIESVHKLRKDIKSDISLYKLENICLSLGIELKIQKLEKKYDHGCRLFEKKCRCEICVIAHRLYRISLKYFKTELKPSRGTLKNYIDNYTKQHITFYKSNKILFLEKFKKDCQKEIYDLCKN